MSTTIGILGAGLSGVLMGMQLRRAGLGNFTIYEKQPDVGGTWYRNTYPDLHCDVPSHLYCYSFEPNADWSMVYSGQAEIQAYIRSCAEKYDLFDAIRLSTCVEAARFDPENGVWLLEMDTGETATHRVLVSATGGLTAPKLPRIDGLNDFQGLSWHSGAWRHDVDLAGKRVAVVGSAASAVQVVPAVANSAAEVTVYSRTPNWVMPRNNRRYSDEQKQRFGSTESWRRLWRRQYRSSLSLQRVFTKDEAAVQALLNNVLSHMRSAIDDPEVLAALTPDYDPGCQRLLLSDEYYPAFARNHVRLVPHGVTALTADSVVSADGAETPVDVVIFCTGYRLGGRTDGRPAVEVFGRDGASLRSALMERPEAYRGTAIPGFPNYFTVCGINGAVAYTSLFLSAEVETAYIVDWIRRLMDRNLKSVEVLPDVTERYNREIQSELQTMSWAGDCSNFYRDSSGRILTIFPGTLGRKRRELRNASIGDFTVEEF